MQNRQSVQLEVQDWGILAYGEAFERQKSLVRRRCADSVHDCLVLTEHTHVITVGRSGSADDLNTPVKTLLGRGVDVAMVDRGGKATYHGPGQLVAYPVIKLHTRDLHSYLEKLMNTAAAVLRAYGLDPHRIQGRPGLYIDDAKIASVGIALRKWVTYHGLALNVNLDLTAFDWIVPCGQPGQEMTSMAKLLGRPLKIEEVKTMFLGRFAEIFGYSIKTHWGQKVAA